MALQPNNFIFSFTVIISLFTYAIELWGGASYTNYISQIDKFINRAFRNGYVTNKLNFKDVILDRDKKLWMKILNNEKNALGNILSQLNRTLRPRAHNYELPLVRTERFKNASVNRCLLTSLDVIHYILATFQYSKLDS